MTATPCFVGEDNPYNHRPVMALFDYPPGKSGDRLRRIVLGVSAERYLTFGKVDLCATTWKRGEAQSAADQLASRDGVRFVLLGRKVAEAFGVADAQPFSVCPESFRDVYGTRESVRLEHEEELAGAPPRYLLLPHPSPRVRDWSDPVVVARARDALRRFCPAIPWGEADGGPATTVVEARGYARRLLRDTLQSPPGSDHPGTEHR